MSFPHSFLLSQMMDKMLKELNTAFSLGYNVGVFKVEAEERLWVEQNQAKVLQVLASHLDDRRAKNASAAYRHLQPICRAVAEAESPTGGGFGVTKEEDVKKGIGGNFFTYFRWIINVFFLP